MIKFNIRKVGKSFKQIAVEAKIASDEFRHDLLMLGQDAHQFMIDYIKQNTTTSVKNLRNSTPLTEAVDYIPYDNPSGVGFSIGTITKLDEDSPHWYLIDVGGMHPMADKAFPDNFVPGQWEGDGIFVYAPYNGTGIRMAVVNNVIEPMNYVQATIDYMDSGLQKIIQKYRFKLSV